MKRLLSIKTIILAVALVLPLVACAQINTTQVLNIGRNALYFEDYVLSIQYFNQVIKAKPYLAEPYFYRAVAKINLEDYQGAEEDCSKALEINPFILDAYQVRGIARQTQKKFDEAISDYEKGLGMNPEEKVFLMNKAVCEQAIKKYDDSRKSYDELLRHFPRYDKAYLGRAQLNLASGDTLAAEKDIEKSMELSKNNAGAFVMRSEISMRYKKDYKAALADMDEAIKLDPHFAGYFINRAFMKYKLDDYFGAMSDYDYAVSLDPTSVTAHFNRGLLLTEVSDNDRAIKDFSYVLNSEPDNFMARYNRALLYYKTGQFKKAIGDYDVVLNRFPDFEAGLYARSECKRMLGDMKGGERDYNRSRELWQKKKRLRASSNNVSEEQADEEVESESAVMNKFNTLLTVENDNKIEAKYENKTRGRVQDNNVSIEAEPMFFVSYYDTNKKLQENTNYMKEVNEVNDSRMLSGTLVLSNVPAHLFEDEITRHFNSISYYNGLISSSTPRSIDYFARALDFIMVKDSKSAIADLNRAIEKSQKFALAYFVRATARMLDMEMAQNIDSPSDPKADAMLRRRQGIANFNEVLADLDAALKLSPKNVFAFYNKGCVYGKMGDITSAISCYSSAIAIKPDFGEAYYNRGLMYLRLGNKEKGVADLSKAGELGILPSYSVLKRMNN